MSEVEFWQSTAAKIDAMDRLKYPRQSVYYTPQDGPDKADEGAVCEWGDVEGLALSLKGMNR